MKKIFKEKEKKNYVLGLHRGEIVEVRSEREIIATLDKEGSLEGLPFLNEMHNYFGKKFKVLKSVNKLIIEGTKLGMRYIKNTVILDGVTCSGEAHGGCNRTCTLLWKEAWLKRFKSDFRENRIVKEKAVPNDLKKKEYMNSGNFQCQSTSLIKATSPIAKWNIRQYLWDITSGTYKPLERVLQILTSLYFRFYELMGGGKYSIIHGKLRKTPSGNLDLKPGDIVEVKSEGEVLKTLDSTGKNRGLGFTKEMLKYCGKKFRVSKRLDKMINENTGKMLNIANTVILEAVTCDGKAHGGCQRNCLCFWRETWLKRA